MASTLTALTTAPAQASAGSIVAAVNSARASAGRRPLAFRSDLSAVAYRWSQHMASTNTLQHNPSLTRQVSGWRWVGENVGYGPSWGAVETAFMNSPAHRSNILDRDYTQIGVAVVVRNGRVWVTQVFRAPSGARTSTRPSPGTKRPTAHSSAQPAHRPAAHARALKARPKPAPTPTQLLQRRITSAEAGLRSRTARDPLVDALGFSDAMRTVGG
jgi:hypothetical protein